MGCGNASSSTYSRNVELRGTSGGRVDGKMEGESATHVANAKVVIVARILRDIAHNSVGVGRDNLDYPCLARCTKSEIVSILPL
jgi:hypothetical protein